VPGAPALRLCLPRLPPPSLPAPRPPLRFSSHTASTPLHTLSLHDALPISLALTTASSDWSDWIAGSEGSLADGDEPPDWSLDTRSEEHTSELQSRFDLVCRLLLVKKKLTGQISAYNCCSTSL